jgi:hypothetical protein
MTTTFKLPTPLHNFVTEAQAQNRSAIDRTIDFMTVKDAKAMVFDFMEKTEKINKDFSDPRLLDGLINGFSIKEAMVILTMMPLMQKVASNPDSLTEAECQQRFEQTCLKSVTVLNILLLAKVDIEKPATKHLNENTSDHFSPLLEELKLVLSKIKQLYDPSPIPPVEVIDNLWA